MEMVNINIAIPIFSIGRLFCRRYYYVINSLDKGFN